MAERDLADNLAVYPLLYSRCVLLGGLGGRRGVLAWEWRHVPRLVGSQANALVCLVVHQVTDGLAAVSIGQAQLQYGVACLVLDVCLTAWPAPGLWVCVSWPCEEGKACVKHLQALRTRNA